MYIRDIDRPWSFSTVDAAVGKHARKPLPFFRGVRGASYRAAGMNEVYQGFGIGRYGVSNRATYTAASKMGRFFEGGMRALPVAFNVQAAVQGYQEGGVEGAAIGVGSSQVSNYAFGVGWRVARTGYRAGRGAYKGGEGILAALRAGGRATAGGLRAGATETIDAALGVALPALLATAVVAGTYYTLKAGVARTRRTRDLEMGSPMIDPFGTAATMRQRSMQALSNSQINGRSAFGTEAQLLHVPLMR